MSYAELTAKWVTVTKVHKCEWCNEDIVINERAFYRAYKYYNDFQHGYMHEECYDAMTETDFSIDEEWEPGDFKRGSTEPA